jgi:hypothetical protein
MDGTFGPALWRGAFFYAIEIYEIAPRSPDRGVIRSGLLPSAECGSTHSRPSKIRDVNFAYQRLVVALTDDFLD